MPKTDLFGTVLQETTFSENLKVDRESHVIKGVKILGPKSKNGYGYSPEAMQQAAKLYEGRKVNIDHAPKSGSQERSLGAFFGTLRSVQVAEGGVYGDLHYLKSHPLAEQILEAAERFSDQFGLSHDARGGLNKSKDMVESVESVRSVDLVSTPATVAGLFESVQEEPVMKKWKSTLREIVLREFGKPGIRILEMDEVAAAMPAETEVTMEAPAEGEPAGEDQVKAAFRAAVIEAFDDDSLDMKATLNRIKEVLKAYDKLNGGAVATTETGGGEGGGEGGEGGGTETTETEESVKLKNRLNLLESKDKARSLLVSKNRKPTDERIAAVAGVGESLRVALVESWPEDMGSNGGTTRQRPAYSAPIRESQSIPATPTDAKEFCQSLRD